MAERSALTQVVQLGIETTPGTAVAATKKLAAIDIETKVENATDMFRPAGFKFTTVTGENKEWVSANIKGQPTYTEIIYPLSSVIVSPPTATQFMDGGTPTTVYKWVFEPSTSAPDTLKTFTLEQGDSVRAHKFTNGAITEFNMNFNRDKVELGGKLVGQLLTDGITLTGSLSSVALVPIQGEQFSVYLDTTSGGLGVTKLTRVFDCKFSLTNRIGPFWTVDAAQASFAGTVELVPKVTFKATVETDAAGMALLGYLRTNVTYFLRFVAQGATLYNAGVFAGAAALRYQYQQDMAVNVVAVSPFTDHEGIYAAEFEFEVVHDPTWGKALHIEVQNKLATL